MASIVPAMTSNTAPSPYVATAYNYHPAYPPYKAFDGIKTGDATGCLLYGTSGYVQIDLGASNVAAVLKYQVTTWDQLGSWPGTSPRNWQLLGSSNGTDWDVLDTRTGETGWTNGESRDYLVSTSGYYRYYKLDISLNDGSASYTMVEELELYVGTLYEYQYDFFASFITEGFTSFFAGPALKSERAFQYTAGPSYKFETSASFFALRSQIFEQEESLIATGLILSEQEGTYYARGTVGLSEEESSFYTEVSANYIFENEASFIAGWRPYELTSMPSSYGVVAVVDGVNLPVISISGGRTGYFYSFAIQCPDNAFTRSIAIDSQLQLTFFNQPYEEALSILADIDLFIYSKQNDWQAGNSSQSTSKIITFECRSATAALDILPDNRGALLIDQEWAAGTKVSDILDDICPPSIPYTINSVNYTVTQKYAAEKRTPAQIIADLFAGLLASPANNGGLVIGRKLPIRASALANATPDVVLDPSEYVISSSDAEPIVNYYNQVTAATVAVSGSVDLRAPVIVEDQDDPSKATVYGYRVPFDQNFILKTSHTGCGGLVVSAPIYEEVELPAESVEFIDGEASLSLPISQLISIDWDCNDALGTVVPYEDGKLEAAIKNNSLSVSVIRKVKRMKWNLTGYNKHDIQLWFEDV